MACRSSLEGSRLVQSGDYAGISGALYAGIIDSCAVSSPLCSFLLDDAYQNDRHWTVEECMILNAKVKHDITHIGQNKSHNYCKFRITYGRRPLDP